MGKIVLLKEGSVRKGGHNEMPTRPRPKTPPKGQGGNEMKAGEKIGENFKERKSMSKYLEFSLIERKPKTKVIGVWSKKSANRLGVIKWFPGWRQYAFFPENETVFNVECLNDIQVHITELR